MGTYILRRVLMLIPMLLAISFVSYSIIFFTPGDIAQSILIAQGFEIITEEKVEELRAELGLNDPIPIQYGRWLWRVIHLDFGKSLRMGSPVGETMWARFPATFKLASASMFLALLISIPIGVAGAVKQHSWIDHVGRIFALLGVSIPSYWLGLMLILAFAVKLHWLPAMGSDTPKHIILPALTLSLVVAPTFARLLRSSMLEVLNKSYITTARAKGVAEWGVIIQHGMRNALIPFVTVFGINFAYFMGGTVVLETIFAWPGIGKLALDAILSRDYPFVQAFTLWVATAFVLINLLVDISYYFLDPRIRSDRLQN